MLESKIVLHEVKESTLEKYGCGREINNPTELIVVRTYGKVSALERRE